MKTFLKTLAVALLIITIAGTLTAAAQKPAGWSTYRPDGAGFEALMPSSPEVTPLGGGKVRYQSVSNGLVFQVMRADMGDADSGQLREAVEGLKQGLKGAGAYTTSDEPAKLGGCLARELSVVHPEFFARVRMIVTGGVGFTAGVAAKTTALLRSPEAEAFFSSFRPLRGCSVASAPGEGTPKASSARPLNTGEPTLEETLAWLREKLLAYAPNETRSDDGRVLGTWFKLVRFEGCELTWREEMYTEKGTLSGETSLHLGDLNPEGTKIQQEPLGGLFLVDLNAPAGKSLIRHRVLSDGRELMAHADETARLRFKDGDMARRVDRAFSHAVRLCTAQRDAGRKEPF